jgi:hypothetical protein
MNVNCREYQHQITLLLYEELPERVREELEAHLRECTDCQDAYESEKALHLTFADDAASWDVPSDLLVESRKALADELDLIERKRSWWRVPAFSVVFTPMRLLESAALVAMGLALGVYVSNQRVAPPSPPEQQTASVIPDGTISNLQVLNSDPSTGQVELAAQLSKPIRFQGRMDDETVRQLLFSALRDAENPGSRSKAVEVLSQKPTDETVEEALINALVYDEDPGVRAQALDGLKKYAHEQHVREAFMHALQNDKSPNIRVEAIDALTKENPKDPSLADKIEKVTKRDDNAYIHNKALQYVSSTR